MPQVTYEWHDWQTKQIMLMDFKDNWTWTDYAQSHEPMFAIIRELDHPVVIIQTAASASAAKLPPGNGFAVIRSMISHVPAQVLAVFVVNANMLVSQTINIFARFSALRGLEIRAVSNLETAIALANQRLQSAKPMDKRETTQSH